MAKVNKKVAKTAETVGKVSKVDAKSVAIQKADKSPKKAKKAKSGKVKLEKKTTPKGGAPIVPKKNAKKLQKASNALKEKLGKELVSKDEIATAVTTFKTAVSAALAERKALLDPDFRYILQMCSFKIPQCPERIARTQLEHSLYTETDDVCLFVKDIEAGHKRDYQPTIDYFREKLDAAGITNIKTIMPMSQLVKDYKQHEMVRKLSNTYDCFLADVRIAPHLAKMLGKTFTRLKKSPIPVRMNHKQLKEHLNQAQAKVQYQQTNSGDSIAVYVAKHCMEESKVVDNIHRALQNMRTEFHGGWPNLKRAYLRPAMNLAKSSILVYTNPSTGVDVPIPVVSGPRAEAVAEKQKTLNKLLPDGLVMTSKGELALVENRKRPAAGGKPEKIKAKKAKTTTKKSDTATDVATPVEAVAEAKQSKKKVKESKTESVPVVAEEAAVKKPKKGKKSAEPALQEEVAPVETKKGKKSAAKSVEVAEPTAKKDNKKATNKKQDKKAPVTEVTVEPTKESNKKNKKQKPAKPETTSDDVADADLSREVSDLWEQIKSETGAPKRSKKDVDQMWEQAEKDSAVELEEIVPKKAGQKNKRKNEEVAAAATKVTTSGEQKKSKKQKK